MSATTSLPTIKSYYYSLLYFLLLLDVLRRWITNSPFLYDFISTIAFYLQFTIEIFFKCNFTLLFKSNREHTPIHNSITGRFSLLHFTIYKTNIYKQNTYIDRIIHMLKNHWRMIHIKPININSNVIEFMSLYIKWTKHPIG